jgi:hypothetical protein
MFKLIQDLFSLEFRILKIVICLGFSIWDLEFLALRARKGRNCPPRERLAAHQLVGRVMAYQGNDG